MSIGLGRAPGTLFDNFITKGKKTLEDYAMVDFTVPPAEKAVLDTLAANCTCPEFGDISMNEVVMTYDYKGWKELLAEILVYEANDAKVPNYITTTGPNDLISILGR